MENNEKTGGPRRSKLLSSENMIYCTTKIAAYYEDELKGYGTGFYYRVDGSPDESAGLLITNKHVIKGCDRVIIPIHLTETMESSTPSRTFADVTLIFENNVIMHPDDNVDLCAIPIASLIDAAINSGHFPFFTTMSKKNIPTISQWDSFTPIEQVKMVGCPNGLFDDSNNLPLVRQGITATPIYNHYKSQAEFIVDIACFPGSSGSPVFIHNEGTFFDRKSNSTIIGNRLFLAGILYAGPVIDNHGKISFGQAKDFSVPTMMHLGLAIRADQLLAFDDYFQADYLKHHPRA